MAEKLSESLGPENLPGGHGEESFFSRVRRAFSSSDPARGPVQPRAG